MSTRIDTPQVSDDADRQAKAETERAKAALDNVREGYGRSPSLPPGGAAPDPTPHGQVPSHQRKPPGRADTD